MSNQTVQNLSMISGLLAGATLFGWLATSGWLDTLAPAAVGVDPVLAAAAGAILGVLAGWGVSRLLQPSAPPPKQSVEPDDAEEAEPTRTSEAPPSSRLEEPDLQASQPIQPPGVADAEPEAASVAGDEHADEDSKIPPPLDVNESASHSTIFDDLENLEEHSEANDYQPSLKSIVVALSDVEQHAEDESTPASTDSVATSSTTSSEMDSDAELDEENLSFDVLASAMGGSDTGDSQPDSSDEEQVRDSRSGSTSQEVSPQVEPMEERPIDNVAAVSPFGGKGDPDSEPGEWNLEVDPSISSIDDLASSFGSDINAESPAQKRSSQGLFDIDDEPNPVGLEEHTASYSETATMAVPTRTQDSSTLARERTESAAEAEKKGRLRVPQESLVASRMGIIGRGTKPETPADGPGDRLRKGNASSDPATRTRRVDSGKLDRIRRSSVVDSETEIQRLYGQFLDQIGGRRAANSVMDYKKFQKVVEENRRRVREKYGVDAVEMSVEVESGRPKIIIRPAG